MFTFLKQLFGGERLVGAYSRYAFKEEVDAAKVTSVSVPMGNGVYTLTTGIKHRFQMPFSGTIQSVTLVADVSGSTVVDIEKSTYGSYPSTNSICAAAKPTLSSAQTYTDSTLTGWTTTVTAGDVLEFEVESASMIKYVSLTLKILKT